jgi:hypothetical protein
MTCGKLLPFCFGTRSNWDHSIERKTYAKTRKGVYDGRICCKKREQLFLPSLCEPQSPLRPLDETTREAYSSLHVGFPRLIK